MKGICFFFRAANRSKKEKGETTFDEYARPRNWGELLHSAVHTPGKLLTRTPHFTNYSFGNALLAFEQCIAGKSNRDRSIVIGAG